MFFINFVFPNESKNMIVDYYHVDQFFLFLYHDLRKKMKKVGVLMKFNWTSRAKLKHTKLSLPYCQMNIFLPSRYSS